MLRHGVKQTKARTQQQTVDAFNDDHVINNVMDFNHSPHQNDNGNSKWIQILATRGVGTTRRHRLARMRFRDDDLWGDLLAEDEKRPVIT